MEYGNAQRHIKEGICTVCAATNTHAFGEPATHPDHQPL